MVDANVRVDGLPRSLGSGESSYVQRHYGIKRRIELGRYFGWPLASSWFGSN
ncbi:MAG: hypothetical protein JWN70_1059 [Planctomycetaceae bacterium]|nr:hypothetical protein [Planctomycetaceae bacterium]